MNEDVETILERVTEFQRTKYFGKYRGLVADIEDPEGLGRLREDVCPGEAEKEHAEENEQEATNEREGVAPQHAELNRRGAPLLVPACLEGATLTASVGSSHRPP